ncbi:MAG: hypothetical protein IT552_08680 [Sphingomonadaceae bacterium]|nr:hypothetical protein [Sphingomonadaceae bacterium]
MSDAREWLLSHVTDFSGNKHPRLDQRIFADLDINGSDYVDFFDKIDKKFRVDTKIITEDQNGKAVDPTVEQVITFIEQGKR